MNNNTNIQMEADGELSQDQQIYEQDQVIWAKIKGYPWWPAYVRNINEENSDGEIQYTVYFFGDNTQYLSSRLGASKIRKFQSKYREFFKGTKTNHGLKTAIYKAEEKLKENGQNVEIFEQIRIQIGPKKRRNWRVTKPESKADSSEHNNSNVFDLPDLSNSKHYSKGNSKTHDARINRLPSQEKVESSGEKNRNNENNEKIEQQSPEDQDKASSSEKVANRLTRKTKQLNRDTPQVRNQRRPRRPRGSRKIVAPVIPDSESSSSSDDDNVEKQQQKQEASENSSSSSKEEQEQSKIVKRYSRGRGKRRIRRPGKRSQIVQPVSSSQSDDDGQSPQKKVPERKQPRKRGRKPIIKASTEQQNPRENSNMIIQEPQQQEIEIPDNIKENILERVKFFLGNRQQLIETLMKVPVTIENIKQVLDLGVSDIVRDGEITSDVRFLLEYLKAVLLYRYFPDDAKIRKKYEKIVKKKVIMNRSEQRKAQEEYTLSNDDLEIRRKTILKLEKIIREEATSNSKDCAQKIESFFRRRDPTIADGYKEIAYRILRILKDKTESVDEVIKKLEDDQYD